MALITKSQIIRHALLFDLQRALRAMQTQTLNPQVFSLICSWGTLPEHTEQSHITTICGQRGLDSTTYTALCSAFLWKPQSRLNFYSEMLLSFMKSRQMKRNWLLLRCLGSAVKSTHSNFSNTLINQLNNLSTSDSISDSWTELNCNRECLGFSNLKFPGRKTKVKKL